MKRNVVLMFAAALIAPMPILHAADDRPSKPNFVIIFIDDMGYGDIGPYGATKQKTPNLDRMAREGMKLTSFYAAPVCSVSRAQLLTGCYGARVSVPGVFGPGHKQGLNPKEFTIAERLKELGYATMCIGKWHVGDQPEFLPTKQGFDHYLGLPYSNDMLRKSKERGVPVVPLVRDDKVIQLLTSDEEDCIVGRYTDEAVRYIRESKDHPFLLYLAHTAVHTPIHPGPAFVGKSENGRFGDWVQEVDWSVGKVFETLRELKLDQNTVVIFTSDNGPWLVKGADAGNAGPLRGGKGSTWEGGMREPTIAWWPGKIAAGTACDAVAGTIDLLPTFVSIAGGKVPAEPVIDGRDISPLLFGKSKESQREAHYYFHGYNLQAVRQGPWKLAIAPQGESMGRGVTADAVGTAPRLYNLDEEIGEKTNLADKHPDIVAKLKALAEKMDAEIGGNQPSARRPAGEVENARMLYETGDDEKPVKKKGKKERAAIPAKSESAKLETLKPGDTLTSEAAPQIASKPFTISCVVETDRKDAILLAHGGSAIGYALHMKDGHVYFAVRNTADKLTEISSGEMKGPAKIIASLAADGTMTLTVDDQPAVTGKAAGLIARQPQEDFCLGHDNKVAVTTYSTKELFHGSISSLTIQAQ
jgi:arylsulfatase A-like enzyme